MTSGNVIGHSGYGGQYLAINLKTGNVAAFFSPELNQLLKVIKKT